MNNELESIPGGRQARSSATGSSSTGHSSAGSGSPGDGSAGSGSTVEITPWVDPLVDAHGYDPRSRYFERFWLSVVGPTATLVMRRIADGFDEAPDGFTLDMDHTASTMGLSFKQGPNSPFGRALNRCVMFGLARPTTDGYWVRRRVPAIADRHLRRLPADVQQQHADWLRTSRDHSEIRVDLERLLRNAGLGPSVIAHAVDAALLAS